ncbi:MAG: response regulator [Gammaproteobacteria bacterium]
MGIRGIANLTHHIEDILVAFSKHQTLPTAVLNQTLTHAADTLEAMSEALAGISDAPPERQTLALMQEVLDWANLIDRQGIPGDAERPKVRDALPGLKAAEPAVEEQTAEEHHAAAAQPAMAEAGGQKAAAATTPSAAARVSADLVDELLRLAGEAMILNRQLQDRLVRTQNQLKSIHSHNSNIQQMVLELEQLVDVRGISSPMLRHLGAGGFDPLEMEQYNELHTVSRRLLEAVTDTREMNREVDSHLTLLDGLLNDQRRVQRENEETVMRTRMVPVKTIAARLQRSVRQACRLTGKEAELVLNGGETLMDSEVLNSLVDPLMHLLRNAVDHGIERPEERAIIGKPRSGSIVLDFWREGNSIVVRCKDDGAGLNYAAIRYAAIERGLLRENQRVSEEELARLIMMPGFSTRSEATQVSGRGIGMDAVYTRVQELKGSLNIRSEANKGSQFDLKLPVTLLSTHGLLVRVQKRLFAVSDRSVEQILYSGSGSLGRVGNKTTYQIGDDIYEATALDNLLGLGDPQDDEHRLRPALLVREESGRNRVVFVDEVIDSLDLVVKNMGRYIPTIRGIMGATILGDGSATAVLDLPELLAGGKMRARGGAALKEAAPAAAVSRAPLALVVDDSLTARRVLADFVKDLGYEVRTASDGLEAVAILEQRTPNILLVDMEMPRMNGLELTSHVRSNAQTKHLPVIMITSRSTEKHRQSAEQAGVNAYLVKPFSEDELAKRIQELQSLKGAA